MYKVNPAIYDGVVPLPSVIANKYLMLTSLPQLKTVIFIFANINRTVSIEEISDGTGLKKEEAEDAVTFWIEEGIVLNYSSEINISDKTENIKTENNKTKPEKPQAFETKPTRLSRDMILKRLSEDEMISILFQEAQTKLGRTIGTSDQSSLLLLHDYYGLPVEIILTICEYARTHDKANNMNYIYTIGVDWSKREIDTLDRADDELKRIESSSAKWKEFCSITGFSSSKPTPSQTKYMRIWTEDWCFPMNVIVLAYEEMINSTESKNSLQYINKVLSNWNKKGIKTPEEVENNKKAFIENKEKEALQKSSAYSAKKTKTADTTNSSYDIQKAELKAKTTVPKLKKREKR